MTTAAILTIGTELTRGELVDTNGAWLAEQLTSLGVEVAELATVSDETDRIISTIRRLATNNALVICTGGLGPTSDDLTAACVARAAGVSLVRNEQAIAHMVERFEHFGRRMPSINRKQADLPSGARMLLNRAGTAPGFACNVDDALVIGLPGVPREVRHLWNEHVKALAADYAGAPVFQTKLRTFGSPESDIAEKLVDLESMVPGVTVAYRASAPEIEVKFMGRGATGQQARRRAEEARQIARERLGKLVFSDQGESFVSTVARAIRSAKATLAIAESCTGGLISEMITSEPASDYFLAGITTYSNETKQRLLGVDEEILREHGAVSEQVAKAMAEGVRDRLGATFGAGVTGIAGPTGGTKEKPVGLVYWAVATPSGTIVRHAVFPGDRNKIQRWAAYALLSTLRESCSQSKSQPSTR